MPPTSFLLPPLGVISFTAMLIHSNKRLKIGMKREPKTSGTYSRTSRNRWNESVSTEVLVPPTRWGKRVQHARLVWLTENTSRLHTISVEIRDDTTSLNRELRVGAAKTGP